MSGTSKWRSIYTDDSGQVARATEVLSRAAAGLALEGIDSNLRVQQLEWEDDDTHAC